MNDEELMKLAKAELELNDITPQRTRIAAFMLGYRYCEADGNIGGPPEAAKEKSPIPPVRSTKDPYIPYGMVPPLAIPDKPKKKRGRPKKGSMLPKVTPPYVDTSKLDYVDDNNDE